MTTTKPKPPHTPIVSVEPKQPKGYITKQKLYFMAGIWARKVSLATISDFKTPLQGRSGVVDSVMALC
jgi:hypothetical protein